MKLQSFFIGLSLFFLHAFGSEVFSGKHTSETTSICDKDNEEASLLSILPTDPTWKKIYKEALQHYQAGRLQEGIQVFKKAHKEDKNDPDEAEQTRIREQFISFLRPIAQSVTHPCREPAALLFLLFGSPEVSSVYDTVKTIAQNVNHPAFYFIASTMHSVEHQDPCYGTVTYHIFRAVTEYEKDLSEQWRYMEGYWNAGGARQTAIRKDLYRFVGPIAENEVHPHRWDAIRLLWDFWEEGEREAARVSLRSFLSNVMQDPSHPHYPLAVQLLENPQEK